MHLRGFARLSQNGGQQQECFWTEPSRFVLVGKLNFNFIGIETPYYNHYNYYDYENSICKHSGRNILRYYIWKNNLLDILEEGT